MDRHRVLAFVAQPFSDTWRGLDHRLDRGLWGLALTMLGLLLGWWIYVPCHEMLHVAGCVLAGGEVTRLEISRLYGGTVLESLFPFVTAGDAQAGRLTGFDTGGSDLVYLATDLAPYLLTLFPGVWAMRAADAASRPILFGLALPLSLAPFVSLSGDAYEIGSILVTRLPPWSAGGLPALLRGDDLLEKLSHVGAVGGARAWSGLGLAAVLGAAWALSVYLLGAAIAARLGAEGIESHPPEGTSHAATHDP